MLKDKGGTPELYNLAIKSGWFIQSNAWKGQLGEP